MSTKLLNPDGSPANFDTGSRAVLVPQLGWCSQPERVIDHMVDYAPLTLASLQELRIYQ